MSMEISHAESNEKFKDDKINEHKGNIMKMLGKAILKEMQKAKEKKSTVGKIKEKLQHAIVA